MWMSDRLSNGLLKGSGSMALIKAGLASNSSVFSPKCTCGFSLDAVTAVLETRGEMPSWKCG